MGGVLSWFTAPAVKYAPASSPGFQTEDTASPPHYDFDYDVLVSSHIDYDSDDISADSDIQYELDTDNNDDVFSAEGVPGKGKVIS